MTAYPILFRRKPNKPVKPPAKSSKLDGSGVAVTWVSEHDSVVHEGPVGMPSMTPPEAIHPYVYPTREPGVSVCP